MYGIVCLKGVYFSRPIPSQKPGKMVLLWWCIQGNEVIFIIQGRLCYSPKSGVWFIEPVSVRLERALVGVLEV